MPEHRWICSGNCGATLTEAEYQKSKKVCGASGCERQGQPFVKAEVCSVCGALIRPGERHRH